MHAKLLMQIMAIPGIFVPQQTELMKFTKELLSWYYANKRDLPWRLTKDPYFIWLSEIILQQTRIDQGMPYYERFVNAFPTIRHLADANEQEVLKLWQGLGYYSRARNLHATARTIVMQHGGVFPQDYAGIRQLKGIGDYTAAAIASICFELPYAVVDGNVLRFIARLYGIKSPVDLPPAKKEIQGIVNANIDRSRPGDFNQALMEFGAIVCTPTRPGCAGCTLREMCVAFRDKIVHEVPAKTAKPLSRKRFLHYLVMTVIDGGKEHIYLNRRTEKGIWKNLYDFPCMETSSGKETEKLAPHDFSFLAYDQLPEFTTVSEPFVHLLTHQRLQIRFYRCQAERPMDLPYELVPLEEFRNYPVPKPVEQYMALNILPGDLKSF